MPETLVRVQTERGNRIREGLRLPYPQEPIMEMLWPASLSTLSNLELSDHLTFWSALASYALAKVAELDGARLIAQLEFEEEFDLRYTSIDGSVTDKKHRVGAYKSIREKKRKWFQLQADLKILQALHSGYESKYHAVSRELTRRKSEQEMIGG